MLRVVFFSALAVVVVLADQDKYGGQKTEQKVAEKEEPKPYLPHFPLYPYYYNAPYYVAGNAVAAPKEGEEKPKLAYDFGYVPYYYVKPETSEEKKEDKPKEAAVYQYFPFQQKSGEEKTAYSSYYQIQSPYTTQYQYRVGYPYQYAYAAPVSGFRPPFPFPWRLTYP